ncbi:MAG: DNA recombination/repair protein RecA, partial [Acidobacteriota bacterium]
QFDIIFGEGISKEGDLVDIGFETGILDKSGTWFSYKGERLGQGRDNVKRLFKENKELAAQVDAEIRQKVGLEPDKDAAEKPAKEK